MKKTTLSRILALFLMAVMLVSVLASCGGDKSGDDKPVETVEGDENNPNIAPVDYEGYEFTFICQPYTGQAYQTDYMVAEADTGNTLYDAVYRRNALLQEKYNITFSIMEVKDLREEVRMQMKGGTVEFDLIVGRALYLATLARENNLYDLNTIERFDMTKPYWDQNAAKELTMGGKLYFTNCDLNVQEVGFSVYFNKFLIEELKLESPYDLMDRNEWTIDKWAELCLSTEVAKDVDGDGVQSVTDRYGTLYEHHNGRMFFYGADLRATTNNEAGIPEVSIFKEDGKAVNVYNKVKEVFSSPTHSWDIDSMSSNDKGSYPDKWDYCRSLFCQDLYLFHYEGTNILHQFADMEHEFGILPFPKYDSNQKEYKTMYPRNCAMIAIPNMVENLERTANIIEDMNYYSSLVLKPAWYDTLLSRRYARDDESERSLDLILAGRVYDIGMYFDFGSINSALLSQDARTVNITRTYARLEKTIQKDIKAVYEDFIDAGNAQK